MDCLLGNTFTYINFLKFSIISTKPELFTKKLTNIITINKDYLKTSENSR